MLRKYLLGAALGAAAVSAPLQAKVISEGNGAFVTRDSAVVEADLRATWLTLISPGEWWDDAHTWSGDAANMSLTPQGGGCFCERIPAKDTKNTIGLDGSVQHMVVLNATPDLVLRMRGGLGPLQSEPVDGVLTIALSKTDKGTLIVFEYVVGGFMRFETPTISKAVDGVMSQQLSHLADKLGRVDKPEQPAAKPEEPEKSGDAEDKKPAEPAKDDPKKSDRVSVDDAFGGVE